MPPRKQNRQIEDLDGRNFPHNMSRQQRNARILQELPQNISEDNIEEQKQQVNRFQARITSSLNLIRQFQRTLDQAKAQHGSRDKNIRNNLQTLPGLIKEQEIHVKELELQLVDAQYKLEQMTIIFNQQEQQQVAPPQDLSQQLHQLVFQFENQWRNVYTLPLIGYDINRPETRPFWVDLLQRVQQHAQQRQFYQYPNPQYLRDIYMILAIIMDIQIPLDLVKSYHELVQYLQNLNAEIQRRLDLQQGINHPEQQPQIPLNNQAQHQLPIILPNNNDIMQQQENTISQRNWMNGLYVEKRQDLGNQFQEAALNLYGPWSHEINNHGQHLRTLFTTDYRVLPFILFIQNWATYNRELQDTLENHKQELYYEDTDRCLTYYLERQLATWLHDLYPGYEEYTRDLIGRIMRSLQDQPPPLWMLEFICNQISLYDFGIFPGTKLNESITDNLTYFEGKEQEGRGQFLPIQVEDGQMIEWHQRFPIEIGRWNILNPNLDLEGVATLINKTMIKFRQQTQLLDARVFLMIYFVIKRISTVNGRQSNAIIPRQFEMPPNINNNTAEELRDLILEMFNTWLIGYGYDIEFDLTSLNVFDFRIRLMSRNLIQLPQALINLQKQQDDYLKNLQELGGGPIIWTKPQQQNEDIIFNRNRRIQCQKWDSTFKGYLLHSDVTRGGICLFEAFFWCMNPDKIKIKGDQARDIIMQEFENLSSDDKIIFFDGDLMKFKNEFLPMYTKKIGIYEFYKEEMIYPASFLDRENVKETIVIKDGHAFAIKWDKDIKKQMKIKNSSYDQKKKNYGIKIVRKKEKINKSIKEKINWFLDIETYNFDGKGTQLPYLLCLVSEDVNKEPRIFRGLDCVEQFMMFCKEELVDQSYKNSNDKEQVGQHLIWSFNGAKFDYLFLLAPIMKMFTIEMVGDHTSMKELIFANVRLLDFRNIFSSGSLRYLAKSWKVEYRKTDFDYKKVKTLDDVWKYMEESVDYCVNDCKVLLALFNEYRKTIQQYEKYDFHSGTALSFYIFKNYYLASEYEIEGIIHDFYQVFKDGYRGGMVQHLKKSSRPNEILYYMDVNSMYPFIMTGDIPIKLLHHRQIEFIVEENNYLSLIDNQCFYAIKGFEWKKECKIPFFGIHHPTSGLLYLTKHDEVYYLWGCELIRAFELKMLNPVKVFQKWEFQMAPIFEKYILESYTKRKQYQKEKNKAGAELQKLKMNSLYGKFGQRIFGKSEYVTMEGLRERIMGNKKKDHIKNITELTDSIWKIDYSQEDYDTAVGSCVFIASYITAKARVLLMDYVYKCGQDNVWYYDTDSIISNQKLEFSDKLGDMKQEAIILDAKFIGAKVYYYLADLKQWVSLKTRSKEYEYELQDTEAICHMKGVNKKEIQLMGKSAFEQLNDTGILTVKNKDVFQKSIGKVIVSDQIKILHTMKKRKFIDDFNSLPCYDIHEFNALQLVK